MLTSSFKNENLEKNNVSKECELYKNEPKTNLVSFDKGSSIWTFFRFLFYSTALKTQDGNNYCDQKILDTSDDEDSSNLKSSGYHSLENSCEIEDSYIKVSRFSGEEEDEKTDHYGTFKEYQEMYMQQKLASEIKSIVEHEHDEITHCITISDYLTLRTAGDVMNLSKHEPYGLKGCKLILIIEDGSKTINLGSIFPEKGIISTFEITLVLHLRKNPCRRVPFFNCKPKGMEVIEQYELRKEKMYTAKQRRLSPTIRL
ncbi:uncharacterized protein LOC101239318 [Hydra vulgaris]|uniref:Uncharacterized protein LOC101239318 n=1 Tax=Hydra vulgaris TaxID=6087 RepID=A0ABM4BQZ7_HYDVU